MVEANLLPASRATRMGLYGSLDRTTVLGAIAVVLVLAMIPITIDRWIANADQENQMLSTDIGRYNASVGKIAPLKAEYKSLSDKLQWYYTVAGTGLDTGAVLKELQVTIPADVWLTSMVFSVDGTASLSGVAMDLDAVGQFMSQLKLSPVFAYVELVSLQQQTISNSDATSFQLKASINRA